MFQTIALTAFAAAAAMGASLLSPTAASAGFHGGGHGAAVHAKVHNPGFVRGPRFNRFPPHRPHWHIGHRRPIWYAAPLIAAPVAYAVSRPVVAVPGPCTCLTKEYTPDGRVLFKDRCTNEAAINPPIASEAPQQQSSLAAPAQLEAGAYQAQPHNMMPQQPVQ